MDSKPKRGRIVTIRFTDEEYDELLRFANGESISTLIRILIKDGLNFYKSNQRQHNAAGAGIPFDAIIDKFDGLSTMIQSLKHSFSDAFEKQKERFRK
ncbi:hypothetical protein MCHI_003636 [Candidatus Magnetoovum chiemensis]|nr:hypothetical protein MCHI_003636 [Candidatus Magnetoovum chiemensis]